MEKLVKLLKLSFTGKYALLTNTISGAGLFILGDLIEQKMEIKFGKHEHVDSTRIARIGTIGLIESPPHYYFYKYLDKYFPGKTKSIIMKKIFLDQMIACPMFNFQFFIGMALLEGKNWTMAWGEFTKKFPTVYFIDWLLWPPCQIINFYYVPGRYRVLYVNCVTVIWNIFLSYMKHYDQFE